MATTAKYRHQDIAAVPRGWKVRTVSNPRRRHQVRIAYPPGPRQKGSGKLISILHPAGERNPDDCGQTIILMRRQLAGLEVPDAEQFAESGALGDLLDLVEEVPPATPNPAWWDKLKAKVKDLGQKVKAKVHAATENPKYDRASEQSAIEAARKATATGGKLWGVVTAYGWKIGKGERPAYGTPYFIVQDGKQIERGRWKMNPAVGGGKGGKYPGILGVGNPRKLVEFDAKSGEWAALSQGKAFAWRKTKSDALAAAREHAARLKRIATGNGRPKRNLDEIAAAQQLAERFRGRKTGVEELDEPDQRRDDFAQLGWCEILVFCPPGADEYDPSEVSDLYHDAIAPRAEGGHNMDPKAAWDEIAEETGSKFLVFNLEGEEIRLAASADGNQLYLVGGGQDQFAGELGKFKTNADRDQVYLGDLVAIHYSQKKTHLGDTTEHPYYHVFAEEWGDPPKAYFDKLKNRIFLAGGDYSLDDAEAGIVN